MVVIEGLLVDGKPKNLYIDTELNHQLKHYVAPSVRKKDFDYVAAIDGPEGTGKSVFAMQIAKILDPNFNIQNICYTPEEFVSAITKAEKYQCIVYDEAFTGLGSRSSLSEINRLLVSCMMQMRQKNLFVLLVIPSVFMMDRYAVLHRAKGLFHVFLDENGRRGNWVFYNQQRMKTLWLMGRKTYDYNCAKYNLDGRFLDQYMVNETQYRKKKWDALESSKTFYSDEGESKYKLQRDLLFYLLHNRLDKSQSEIVDLCKQVGWALNQSSISRILFDIRKKLSKGVCFLPPQGHSGGNGALNP